jgi:hypothetical protein
MPSKKGKAKTSSQPNSAKDPPSDAAHSRPPAENLPRALPPEDVFKPTLPETTNAEWIKLQTLADDPKIFLNGDTDQSSVTCLKLYRILAHFNPGTSSRPGDRKDKLWDAFITHVFPILKPHIKPPASAPMETESSSIDFDPLHRKTTRKQLTDAVHTVNPKLTIPSATPRDRLLVLYKVFIDKDLYLPWLTEFISSPKIGRHKVKSLCMEELRMTLQEHAPHVFIHLGPMNLGVLINLYLKFVIGDHVSNDLIVRGFHYSLFRNKA